MRIMGNHNSYVAISLVCMGYILQISLTYALRGVGGSVLATSLISKLIKK